MVYTRDFEQFAGIVKKTLPEITLSPVKLRELYSRLSQHFGEQHPKVEEVDEGELAPLYDNDECGSAF